MRSLNVLLVLATLGLTQSCYFSGLCLGGEATCAADNVVIGDGTGSGICDDAAVLVDATSRVYSYSASGISRSITFTGACGFTYVHSTTCTLTGTYTNAVPSELNLTASDATACNTENLATGTYTCSAGFVPNGSSITVGCVDTSNSSHVFDGTFSR